MISEKLELFTYYDFEFKRNFILRELNRILDEEISKSKNINSSELSFRDKVNLIDSSDARNNSYFKLIHKDLHKCLEYLENKEIPFKDMYVPNADKEYYYRNRKKMNLSPAFRFNEEGVSVVFVSHYVSDKNMLLAYIELLETRLVEIRKYYKTRALKLK